ncbi:RTA1-domain-containing protein [Daldinia sp. FL1419]|nr:RTA1-domain-containing protein [Daldinia sp. FL1419]
MAKLEPYIGDYYLWKYVPSLPAAIIFAILFAVTTGVHCYRLYRTKLWFCLPFAIGGAMEVIGYCARAVSNSRTGDLTPYIIQETLILLPPALFAASVYMILGRIIRTVHGEPYSLIRVNILTKVFVLGDVASFCVQSGGAGLMAQSGQVDIGEKIVVGSLLIQIIMFGLFIITAVSFQTKYQKRKVDASVYDATGWKASMLMLYSVSALIMIRSIFRVVEFSAGRDGYLLSNEWTVYVFDSVLMLAVMVFFLVRYPNNLQRSEAAHWTNWDDELAGRSQNEASASDCDENRPACGNCTISSRQCSFLTSQPILPAGVRRSAKSASPGLFRSSSNASTPSQSSSPISPNCEPSIIQDVNMMHMELFNHCINSNFDLPPLSQDPEKIASPGMIVDAALSSPFLMHEMLAFGALHLAHLKPEKAHFYKHHAVGLQTHALSIFNREMTGVTSENCLEVLVFTWFMTLHTLCDTTDSTDPHTFLDQFVHYLQMQRGVRAVTAEAWHLMLQSKMGFVLREASRIVEEAGPGSHTTELESCIQNSPALDPNEKTVCKDALDRIQCILSKADDAKKNGTSLETPPLSIISWPIIIEADFIRLVSERRPEALLVLAYYAIPLHLCRDVWIIRNAGQLLVDSIRLHLDPKWHRWLDWPGVMMTILS